MKDRKLVRVGGYVSGGVLIAFALLLTGIGFLILAIAVFGRPNAATGAS